MWIEKEEKTFISMPGVPYEMKLLIEGEILPKLKEKYKRPFILHKTILTHGLGESVIAERLEAWEDNLPDYIKLAYLPNFGRVRLRLSAKGFNENKIRIEVENQIQKVLPLIEDVFVGFEDNENKLEQIIGKQLVNKNLTIAVAESCTGGKIAQTFTQHSGASAFFNGGAVTYATQSKIDVLNVSKEVIKKHSVVSAEVAEAMAEQVKKLYKSSIGIATTGNAGPTKGDSNADVGTVFIAIANQSTTFSYKFEFGNHRGRVINKAVNKALELLQKEILKN